MPKITANLITTTKRKKSFDLTLDPSLRYTGKEIALFLNQEMSKQKHIFTSITDIRVNGKLIDYPMPVPLNQFASVMDHCISQIKGVDPHDISRTALNTRSAEESGKALREDKSSN